jgi:ADP-ribosyl-[dinitrogen reductase] hydrolase
VSVVTPAHYLLEMLGAIAGDVIGSRYEFNPVRSTDFDLFPPGAEFTDDTVMTVATAAVLLDKGDYTSAYRDFGRRYPGRGYGLKFLRWLENPSMGPYQSFGNGSAMRVGPVGHVFGSVEETLAEARRSAEVSHNHPEGIKGAQAPPSQSSWPGTEAPRPTSGTRL